MKVPWQIRSRNILSTQRRQQEHEQLQQRQQRDLQHYRAAQEHARTESLKEHSPDAYRSGPAREPRELDQRSPQAEPENEAGQ